MTKQSTTLSDILARKRGEKTESGDQPVSAIRSPTQTTTQFWTSPENEDRPDPVDEQASDPDTAVEEFASPAVMVFVPSHAGRMRTPESKTHFVMDGDREEQMFTRIATLLTRGKSLRFACESAARLYDADADALFALLDDGQEGQNQEA